MFNDALFQEILFPSSGNVNYYVTRIYRKCADIDGNSKAELADLGEEMLHNLTF